MGKNHASNGSSSASRAMKQAVSLRDESSGKTQADVVSLLRVQHLQRLAAWASGEAGLASVGVLLGHRLAANSEVAGIPLGASTFLCQRCESVLQPGFNCTIRIKNNRKKVKRRKKSNSCQNSVAYACHFCGDQNLIWGSGKGIVKSLLSSRKPASMDKTSIKLKGDNRNAATVTTKEGLKHYVAAVSQLESSSSLERSTLEKVEHGNGTKPNLPKDSTVEEGIVSSNVECGQLAVATVQEVIAQKIEVESTNDKCMDEIEPVSSEKTRICESDVTLQSEFPVGSKFVTPDKNKVMLLTKPKDSAELLKTRNTLNKKREISSSVTGKATSSSKSAPNDTGKNTKSASTESAQMGGSSRKRARKGWTTLKQIAEKDELERKEKMDNFVIPFFMQ